MIFGRFSGKNIKSPYRLVRSLSKPARVRIGNENSVEKWIQFSINCMMKQSVSHVRLMYIPWLRVGNIKRFITSMPIIFRNQIIMKRNNVGHQIPPKLLHIFPLFFAFHKLAPGREQIFHRYDSVVGMNKLNTSHTMNSTPPRTLLPLLQCVKTVYILWYGYYQILPKLHRHSLGQKIDGMFVEIIEAISIASFLSKEEKQPWVRLAIRKMDTARILLMVLWETKSIDDKKYIALSEPINEIGKMLGGWNGQLTKNSPCSGEKRRE
jgi:hypothetical protein